MKTLSTGAAEGLRRLLADFYNIAGIKICVYDGEGREIGYYPDRYTSFCALLREDAEMDARCRACDKSAVEHCRGTGRACIYTCHAGLTECIAPILVGDKIGGYVAIGQVREQGQVFSAFGRREKLLRSHYETLPLFEHGKIASALHIVQACAGYELFKSFLYETTRSFAVRFEQYVAAHLADNLDIRTLMAEFRLSRVELYRRVEDAFAVPPAEYIKECRLQYARKLAQESDVPVAEIAERCGVGDYNYFSKLFKKRFGQTVRACRKGKERKL